MIGRRSSGVRKHPVDITHGTHGPPAVRSGRGHPRGTGSTRPDRSRDLGGVSPGVGDEIPCRGPVKSPHE